MNRFYPWDIALYTLEASHKIGSQEWSNSMLVETEVLVLEMHIYIRIRIYDPIPVAVAAVKQGLGIIHLVI